MKKISGKTRTRQHVIADLAVNHLERQVLLLGYTAQRIQHDYGCDLTITTYDGRGQIEGGVSFVQIKATDNLPLPRGRQNHFLASQPARPQALAERTVSRHPDPV